MSPLREAGVLAVGDELLAGAHPDTNTPEIARALSLLGIAVRRAALVSDDREAIEDAVRDLSARFPLLVVTGGLGPTRDDVTRDGVARAFGRELEEDAHALAALQAWFDARAVAMPPDNRRQVQFPRGARVLANRVGTAPGFLLEAQEQAVVVLPGPPSEMRVVLHEEVLPWLRASGRAGPPAPEHRFHLFGLSESLFAQRVGGWMDRDEEPRMGCSVARGVLSVVLRARDPDGARARRALEERVAEFRARFGEHVFSEDDERLEHVLGARLIATGVSFTCAESCTGGLVASLVTSVPGISAVFAQGFVTYSNEAKARQLGVDPALVARHGAVSRETVLAMARGAAVAAGARLSVAVTGIAGPGAGSAAEPVGLLWFATSLDGELAACQRLFPARERDWIRGIAAYTALHLAWRRLVALDPRGRAGAAAPD